MYTLPRILYLEFCAKHFVLWIKPHPPSYKTACSCDILTGGTPKWGGAVDHARIHRLCYDMMIHTAMVKPIIWSKFCKEDIDNFYNLCWHCHHLELWHQTCVGNMKEEPSLISFMFNPHMTCWFSYLIPVASLYLTVVDCGAPDIANARYTPPSLTTFQSAFEYWCEKGLIPATGHARCDADGVWSYTTCRGRYSALMIWELPQTVYVFTPRCTFPPCACIVHINSQMKFISSLVPITDHTVRSVGKK